MVALVKPIYMTEKGLSKTESELQALLDAKRPEIIDYLQDAKDGGDTADNTEYLYLLQELESIDQRIRDLRYKLEHAQLIQQIEQTEVVALGSTVVIREEGCPPETYTIVGSSEADPEHGSISNESPLGRALLNHSIGEEVGVDSPDGQLLFRIVGIS
jgi:transcription elongation factor GreA